MTSAMQQKIIRLATSSRKYYDPGRIMNLLTVDITQIITMIMFSSFLCMAPIMIIVAIVMICVNLGWVGIFAPIILILTTAI